ncbi:MAG: methyl-accepting chemotaxis protein, partial [Thermodesulfovibrionales bacterium]|nr:methyl-accepting chemotaxis protein [Thermodesulfovibrionales bacterium]
MSIKKLLLVVGMGNLVVIGIILSLFISLNSRVRSSTEQMINTDQALLLNFFELYGLGLQTGQATRNILLNPADETAKNNYKKAHEDFIKTLDRSLEIASGNVREKLERVKTLWKEDHELKIRIQDLAMAGKKNEAINLLITAETPKWREVKNILLDLIESQRGIFSDTLSKNDQIMKKSERNLVAVMLVSVIAFSIFLYFMHRLTQRNIKLALQCFDTLQRGELREENLITDEKNFLKDKFNNIVITFRNMMLRIKEAALQVSTASEQIAEASQNFSQRITEQAASIEETSATMEEMSASIKQTAENAREANRLAQEARQSAEAGMGAMVETVRAMEEINRSAQRITSISGVIEEIAFQTNLL